MSRDGLSRDAAFELLVRGSSRSRCNMREIAAEIVQQRTVERPEPPGGGEVVPGFQLRAQRVADCRR
jgi:ANTAR domain-containing protein